MQLNGQRTESLTLITWLQYKFGEVKQRRASSLFMSNLFLLRTVMLQYGIQSTSTLADCISYSKKRKNIEISHSVAMYNMHIISTMYARQQRERHTFTRMEESVEQPRFPKALRTHRQSSSSWANDAESQSELPPCLLLPSTLDFQQIKRLVAC